MKVINYCFFILLSATQVAYADSSFDDLGELDDSDELSEINSRAIKQAEKSEIIFMEKVKMTLVNLPEHKKATRDLEKSWKNTIEKKCHLYTFSSWGTQADTAELNTCLSDEYLAAADFFEQLNY